MRTAHKATTIVAAVGITFGAAACGTDTRSSTLPKVTPEATATSIHAGPAGMSKSMGVDESLRSDLKKMNMAQQSWVIYHNDKQGVAVTASRPGGRFSIVSPGDVQVSPGNVIAVTLYPKGYCISGYNQQATEATSATMSMLFVSENGVILAHPGTC